MYEQLEMTLNCIKCIREALDGVMKYEIIIVDDASSRQTQESLRAIVSPPDKLILNSRARSFAYNNNTAAKSASGEFLCFLNNDVIVQGDWLSPMLNVFNDYPNAGIVGNLQRRKKNNCFDHMGVVFAPEGNPRHFGQYFYKLPFKDKFKEWSAVTAACCISRKVTFEKLGGFDELFVNGCEDVDLCLRMSQSGHKNYVSNESVVIHIKGATEGRKKHNNRNAMILNERWGEYIRANQSVQDQYLHAWTYLRRFLNNPASCNPKELLHALLIQLRILKLKKPDHFIDE